MRGGRAHACCTNVVYAVRGLRCGLRWQAPDSIYLLVCRVGRDETGILVAVPITVCH